MARVLDTETGKIADVPDDVAAAQVASSPRYQDVTNGRVEVRDALGRRGSIALDEAKRAREWGATILPGAALEEERLQREYGDASAKAFAEGLARGASVGLSDVALAETGLVTPEALRERATRNPVAAGAGEVVGTVAPALLPGGQYTLAGQVSRGTAALGARVATSAAGRAAVAGASEGVLYGVGSVISQHAQERQGLTGEKALAEIGISTLTGGLAGAAASRVEAAAARRLLGRTPEEAQAAQRAEVGRMVSGIAAYDDGLADIGARARAAADDSRLAARVEAQADELARPASAAPAEPVPTPTAAADAPAAAGAPLEMTPKQVRRRILEQRAAFLRAKRDWREATKKGWVEPLPAGAQRRGGGVYEVPIEELDDIPSKVNRMSPETVERLVSKPASPEDMAPIEVLEPRTGLRSLRDGNHRLELARRRGDKTIRVWFENDRAAAMRADRPRGESIFDDAVAPMDSRPPRAQVADEAVPPPAATAEGAAAPPPPPPAATAAPAADDPFSPARLIESLAGDAEVRAKGLNEVAEKAAEQHAGTIRRTMEAMGLDFPSAEQWVLRGLDLKKRELQLLREKDLIEAAPKTLLADRRFAAASKSREGVLDLIRTKMDEATADINEAVKRLDANAAAEDLFDANAFRRKVETELLADIERGTVDERAAAARVRRELEALVARTRPDAPPQSAGAASPDGELVPYTIPSAPAPERPRGADGRWLADPNKPKPSPGAPTPPEENLRKLTFAEVEDWKRRLDKSLRWDSTTSNEVRDQLRSLRGMLNADQEARAAQAAARETDASGLFDFWKRSKQVYGQMAELEGAAAKRIEDAGTANRYFSLTDNLAALTGFTAGGGFNPLGLAAGAAAGLLNKWGRERLPFILALQLRKMDGSPSSQVAANAFRRWVQTTDDAAAKAAVTQAGGDVAKAATAPHPFRQYADTLRRSAAMGERELWAAHTALSADEEYRAVMESAGLDYSAVADERGARASAAQTRAEQAAQALDRKLDTAVADAVAGKRKPLKTMTTEAAQARAEKLAKLAESPEALTEAVAERLGGLAGDAPGVAEVLSETALRAASYLSSVAPKPPPAPLGIPALQSNWKPPPSETARFARRVVAVESPLSVLDDIGSGTVTTDAIQALGAVYPELLADIRSRLLQEVAQRQVPLPYRQRMTLSRVLGQPLSPMDGPAGIAVFQAAYAPPEDGQRPAPRSSPSRVSRRIESEMSPAERLANRVA